MIAGLVRPDSGSVRIEGRTLAGDTDPNKRRIGLVPQDLALFDELTAQANLELFAALYDLDGAAAKRAIGEALELVGLADRTNDRVKNYSGGMKRRLNLAAALLHDPQILLLDEPTVGVDPQSRNAIFDNLEVLKQRGKTLVYTTHYMEEAERLCDRVAIIEHGRIIDIDTPQRLVDRHCPERSVTLASDDANAAACLARIPRIDSVARQESRFTVRGTGDGFVTDVIQCLSENRITVTEFRTELPNLEDVFLKLTGHSIRD
jgi:ABC-2 type transport system ATP-binding protein